MEVLAGIASSSEALGRLKKASEAELRALAGELEPHLLSQLSRWADAPPPPSSPRKPQTPPRTPSGLPTHSIRAALEEGSPIARPPLASDVVDFPPLGACTATAARPKVKKRMKPTPLSAPSSDASFPAGPTIPLHGGGDPGGTLDLLAARMDGPIPVSTDSFLDAPAAGFACFSEACAYSAMLLRLCSPLLVSFDSSLTQALSRNARLCTITGQPEAEGQAREDFTVALSPHKPLRAHALPSCWLADPNDTGKQFKSSLERELWSNQQKLYDALLHLQACRRGREYPFGQPATLGKGLVDFQQAVRERLGKMIGSGLDGTGVERLRPENMSATVQRVAVMDQGKMHQLNRRMSAGSSSRLGCGCARGAASGRGGERARGGSGGGDDAGGRSRESGVSRLHAFFPEGSAEHFWYKLLLSLDSYWLCSHLIPLWMARLHHAALGTEYSPSTPPARGAEGAEGAEGPWEEWEADPVAEEQSVLRCCVLARFVGLLLASPYSHAELHSSHPFRAALREVSPHRCRAHSLLFAGCMLALRRMHAWIEVIYVFLCHIFLTHSSSIPSDTCMLRAHAWRRDVALTKDKEPASHLPSTHARMHA
ncbi:MAG: hypothetical protein SGPRY_005009 [Prymnesium sp.]